MQCYLMLLRVHLAKGFHKLPFELRKEVCELIGTAPPVPSKWRAAKQK
jgi:hypothetical protein